MEAAHIARETGHTTLKGKKKRPVQILRNLKKNIMRNKKQINTFLCSLDIKEVKKALHEYKKQELPDSESPYHFEAEIWAGMEHFMFWLKDKKINP